MLASDVEEKKGSFLCSKANSHSSMVSGYAQIGFCS